MLSGKEKRQLYLGKTEKQKKYQYLNMSLILWRTWIHNSLSIFFAKRRRLARKTIEQKCWLNIPYANSGLFTYDEAKIFHASRLQFFASFIASITSYVIFLTSFSQAGIENSELKCQIVCINTIILYFCYLFKYACVFTRMKKKAPHVW